MSRLMTKSLNPLRFVSLIVASALSLTLVTAFSLQVLASQPKPGHVDVQKATEASPVETKDPNGKHVQVQGPGAQAENVKTETGEVIKTPPGKVIAKADEPSEVSTQDFFASVANSIGQAKGLGALGIAALLTQLGVLFFKSALANQIFHSLSGGGKLVAVSGLTVASTLLTMMGQGMQLVPALMNSAMLTAITVFIHQVYTEFFAGAKDTPPPTSPVV